MYNLFIIGNGFDLAHGMETSYTHFMEDLLKRIQDHPSEYKDISYNKIKIEKPIYIKSNPVTITNYAFKSRFLDLLSYNLHNQNWSDIEYLYFNVINNFKDKDFMVQNFNWNNYTESSVKEINQEFEIVKKYLTKYLEEEQKNFKKIDAYSTLFKQYNESTTTVLNFNYTNTIQKYLEDYKNIKLINIHGELNNPDNPIIFGFAANNEESKQLQGKIDNEYLRNIKKFNYNLTNNEFDLKKGLDDGEKIEVYILGHSCGVSDKLILSQIFNHKNISFIWIYYYNDKEGYLQTSINIDRIIDDYSKEKPEDHVFPKLKTFPQCCKMLQYNSAKLETEKFEERVFSTWNNQPIRGSIDYVHL